MTYTYGHMCRDDHVQIGHRDSEHERCPLCRTINALYAAREYIADDNNPRSNRVLQLIWTALESVGATVHPDR